MTISTLTLKQHYLFDLVAGLALAELVWLLMSPWQPLGRSPSPELNPA